MRKKVDDGVPAMVEMKGALADLEASLEPEVLGTEKGPVAEWKEMAEKWEKDPEAPNPFQTLRKDEHLAKVRHDLAVEAAARQAAGKEDASAVRDDMHITEVLAMGLQLEEQQYVPICYLLSSLLNRRALGGFCGSTSPPLVSTQRQTRAGRWWSVPPSFAGRSWRGSTYSGGSSQSSIACANARTRLGHGLPRRSQSPASRCMKSPSGCRLQS